MASAAPEGERGVFGSKAVRVAGVLGLPIALVGLVLTAVEVWPNTSSLKVTAFSVGDVQEIDAAYSSLDDPGAQPMTQVSEPLDVTLTNSGDDTGLITGFRVTISAVSELDSCAAVGGGVDISAEYDARVPVPPPATPFDVSGEIRFEVSADSNDRLAIFLGPEIQPSSNGVNAWLYSGVLTLVQADGKDLEVGPFTVVAPLNDAAYSLEYAEPENTECLSSNAELLASAVQTGGEVSSTIVRLLEGYSAVTAD